MNSAIPAEPSYAPMNNERALILAGGLIGLALLAGLLVSPWISLALGLLAPIIPYWRLDRALILFLAGTLLWPYTLAWNFGGIAWGPSRVLFVMLAFTWLIARARHELTLKRTPLDLAILIFVTAMLWSFAVNSLGMTSDQFSRGLKTFGFSVIEWFVLYYIVVSIPKDWKQARKIIMFIAVIVSVVALVGIIEYLTEFRVYEWVKQFLPSGDKLRSNLHERQLEQRLGALFRGDIVRIVSTTISPHEVGTLMAMTIPMILYFIAYAKRRLHLALWTIALGLVGGALFLSVTRGALIAATASILCLSLLSRKSLLRSAFIVSASIGVILLLIFPGVSDAILSAASPSVLPQEGSLQSRLEDWPEAVKLLRGHELVGIGLAQVSGHQLDYGSQVNVSFKYTDNYYLSATTELGALGIGALLILWLGIFAALGRRTGLQDETGMEIRDLRIAILSSAVAFMVMCFTFDALAFLTVSKFFWVIVALGMSIVIAEKRMIRVNL